MKKLLLAGAAFAALTTAAAAADLPRKTAPMAPLAVIPTFTWTGFYVGVNAGYGFGTNDNDNRFLPGVQATAFVPGLGNTSFVDANGFGGGFGSRNNSRDGFVGGGQIGYNYQFGAGSGFVIGAEVDYQYADFGRNKNNTFLGRNPSPAELGIAIPGVAVIGDSNFGQRSLESFGTARIRLGYAFDRVLVYGTGGLAFTADGGNNSGTSFASVYNTQVLNGVSSTAFLGNAFSVSGNNRGRDDIGYAVGGGVEYAFTNNLTAKIEGLYVNFAGKSNNVGQTFVLNGQNFAYNTLTTKRDTEFAVVRAGLNYKFSMY